MVKSALQTPTILSTDASAPQNGPPATSPDLSFPAKQALPARSAFALDPFNIGSFDLVRNFVEHVVAKNASASLGHDRSFRGAIDWEAVEARVADSSSFEQAIGRAVVIAVQMCRAVFDDTHPGDTSSSPKSEEPFFAFSMIDAVPDFGDESRYRTRVAKRVARIFGIRRTAVTLAVSLVLVVLSVTLNQVTRQGPSASDSSRALGGSVLTVNPQVLNRTSSLAAVERLPVSSAPPAAAPRSLVDTPPLRPHEVFGSHLIGRSIRVQVST